MYLNPFHIPVSDACKKQNKNTPKITLPPPKDISNAFLNYLCKNMYFYLSLCLSHYTSSATQLPAMNAIQCYANRAAFITFILLCVLNRPKKAWPSLINQQPRIKQRPRKPLSIFHMVINFCWKLSQRTIQHWLFAEEIRSWPIGDRADLEQHALKYIQNHQPECK